VELVSSLANHHPLERPPTYLVFLLIAEVMSRKVRKPFTFSNGFQAPVGMTISAHLYATHHDESLYPHADEFDGFRFVPVAEEDGAKETGTGTGLKKTMYTTSSSYLAFGHGRHAWCVLLPASLI
jgi:cytochrome P450